ncbi:DNA-binding transcriptional activator of the SARP family [Streptomyces sp. SceaMP-e96]|uniref:AfsR/SARP family transcriptional regulator n=1 Tax=Streptomyces TaxID=1883 RepID=UPI0008239D22|nr:MULTISPECIES: BTAD domain-containing putative transcriptional regulator [unclassified Streptomyces]MYT16160.1 transcriptional regulator [Streptomyces sp. SID4951]SCK30754.1 DNA-binding transcriptional activator of the SARP family [Streptomyces sp. SceaMP-e96]
MARTLISQDMSQYHLGGGAPGPGNDEGVGLEFRLLGPLEVRAKGEALRIQGVRQRAVLARLLLALGRVVSVDSLVTDVWDGRPPNTGRAQVSICVAALRKLFRSVGHADEVITTVSPGYQLSIEEHRLDTVDFGRGTERGYALARDGRKTEAVEALQEALGLWRGPALGGVAAQFAESEAARLAEQRLLAAEQLMALRLELGEHRSLIGELTALVHASPLREQLRTVLMIAQYRAGQRAEALRTYREARKASIDELGLEPGAELQAAHDSILNNTSPVVRADESRDYRPQIGRVPAQLRSNSTGFFGRTAEVRTLNTLLPRVSAAHGSVVCFISGSPGSGKTELAMHWGSQVLRYFPDGQLFVNLRQLESNRLERTAPAALRRLLRGLGVPDDLVSDDLDECGALYRSILSERRTLIILDDAASFEQVEPLLPGGGHACVLITGLEQFMDNRGAPGVQLGPLGQEEAVELLASVIGRERIEAEPEAVDELVEQCGRLPLALRAAGARLAGKPHWYVKDMATRLSNEARRLDILSRGEHSLRACFDQAVRDLPVGVANAYSALSVIGDGAFGVPAAAEALCLSPADAEDILERLVDLHLLEVGPRLQQGCLQYRYRALLRLHAAERHAAEGSLEQATLRFTRRTRQGTSRPAAARSEERCSSE